MTPELTISIGAAFFLAVGIYAATAQRASHRLRLRLASIADAGEIAEEGDAASQTIERLFLCVGKDREEVVMALRGAGYSAPHFVTLFAAIRFVGTVSVAGICYWIVRGGSHQSHAGIYAIFAGFAVFLLSKMILRSRVAAHMRQVSKELPFLLDTLLLLLESGVSLDQAFRYFAGSQMGGMDITRKAVAAMVDDLQNGLPYAQALDRWADRLAVPGVRELAALFKQALLHGSELGPALRSFTREFSEKRLSASRASIGRKTTQMTMVMIMFMMPALMIVLGGPAVVAVQGAMSAMSHK